MHYANGLFEIESSNPVELMTNLYRVHTMFHLPEQTQLVGQPQLVEQLPHPGHFTVEDKLQILRA